MLEQQHDDTAAKRLRAQQGNDSADDFDDEPERLRNIVAREVGRRAKLEAADRVALTWRPAVPLCSWKSAKQLQIKSCQSKI